MYPPMREPDPTITQGIKLHISFDGVYSYLREAPAVIALLDRYGATYKVVNPAYVDRLSGTQSGKYITVYPFPFDVDGFLKEALPLLQNPHTPVECDIHFVGQIYGRYGALFDEVLVDHDGNVIKDDRNVPWPDFVDDVSLEGFRNFCRGKA